MIAFIILVAGIFILFLIVFGKRNNPEETSHLGYTPIVEHRKPVGKYISDFEVTGVHIGNIKWYIFNHVEINRQLELIPEPTNKYSERAIMVTEEGTCLGYIAEDDLDEVHDIISRPYIARLSSKDLDSTGYLTVKIEINHS